MQGLKLKNKQVKIGGQKRGLKTASARFQVGLNYGGELKQKRLKKLERLSLEQKQRRKKIMSVSLILLAVLLVFAVGMFAVRSAVQKEKALLEAKTELEEPKTPIADENDPGKISLKVKQFVARLEKDVQAKNLELARVSLPQGKAREVDVFLVGRGEYYRLSIERGSAEQAEDMERVIRYLKQKELRAEYVDLRVSGRAYYK